MIPAFIDLTDSSPWRVLPPGIHLATLLEAEARFVTNTHRAKLFGGFRQAVASLEGAGCRKVYLNGSFVTEKPYPGDFDACWEPTGVEPNKLDPVLLDFSNQRTAQKAKYFGELFIAQMPAAAGVVFLDFFQVDKYTGATKGIVAIALGDTSNIS